MDDLLKVKFERLDFDVIVGGAKKFFKGLNEILT